MSNKEIKTKIDDLWMELYSSGITNPLTVIEQITFLMFSRLMDIRETKNEKRAERLSQEYYGIFDSKEDPRRWKNFKDLPADKLISAPPSICAFTEFHILVFFEFLTAVIGDSSSDTTDSV